MFHNYNDITNINNTSRCWQYSTSCLFANKAKTVLDHLIDSLKKSKHLNYTYENVQYTLKMCSIIKNSIIILFYTNGLM